LLEHSHVSHKGLVIKRKTEPSIAKEGK